MNLKDIDNPDFIPTDPNPKSYLNLASQCHMKSVEWQRRGAGWERVAKDVRKRQEVNNQKGEGDNDTNSQTTNQTG